MVTVDRSLSRANANCARTESDSHYSYSSFIRLIEMYCVTIALRLCSVNSENIREYLSRGADFQIKDDRPLYGEIAEELPETVLNRYPFEQDRYQ